jgi:hypothetical protein
MLSVFLSSNDNDSFLKTQISYTTSIDNSYNKNRNTPKTTGGPILTFVTSDPILTFGTSDFEAQT